MSSSIYTTNVKRKLQAVFRSSRSKLGMAESIAVVAIVGLMWLACLYTNDTLVKSINNKLRLMI